MQTLKVIIHGSYYDSQIYSGRLYLWSTKGSIIIIDWDRLIESVEVEERLKLALRCAFLQSEYFYGNDFKLFFQDNEIKKLLEQKFLDLSERLIEFSESDLLGLQLIIAEQDNPLPFPHADSLFYNNVLYIGSPSGVSASTLNKSNKKSISPRAQKLWDGPVLAVAASYSTLALAAGSEGLFQRSCDLYSASHEDAHPIISEHSNSARWMYYSIFSSSYYNSGYLADFDNKQVKESEIYESEDGVEVWEEGIFDRPKLYQRKLREVLSSDSIFGGDTERETTKYTWGVHDKICLAMQNHIDIVQYSPYKTGYNQRFVPLGRIDSDLLHSDIIRGDSALFGYIIELEDGLLIIDSEAESSHWLPGEPVNWRIFPRSKFYTNQLHVVYDEFIYIHSFNQDYFVDQKAKRVGIRHSRAFSPSSRRV